MNTTPINLTSAATIPDGALVRPWRIQSGPNFHGYLNLVLAGGLPVESVQLALTVTEARELRNALDLHLANLSGGYSDEYVTAAEISVWKEEAILEVADHLHLVNQEGIHYYVDQTNGERLDRAAGELVAKLSQNIRNRRNSAEDQDEVLAEQARRGENVAVINLAGTSRIDALEAAAIMESLTPAGNGPGHGAWDVHGTFYTAAAVRNLKVKAERSQAYSNQFGVNP